MRKPKQKKKPTKTKGKKKRLVSGNARNDTRWGSMSHFDRISAHR